MDRVELKDAFRRDLMAIAVYKRRRWSEGDLLAWWTVMQRTAAWGRHVTPPLLDEVKRWSRDLIGRDAPA
jgi:hypothetical protein